MTQREGHGATVGFVGLGNMGWPMAANLVKAGYRLLVHDVDTARLGEFAGKTGAAAPGLAGLAAAEAIVTMLPTGQIVRQVLLEGEGGGLAAGLRPGTLVIDMSSSEPLGTRALGVALAERGAVLIDAPVSGGVTRATAGTLAIMIGSDDPAAVARARALLLAMGDRLFETGGLGSGHAMKALNNFVAAAGFTAAAEALIVGRRFGLDPAAMIDIMNASTGRNFSTELIFKDHVLGGRYASGFALGLLAKDVKIAADLAEAIDIDAPLTRTVRERWVLARDRLGPAADHSAAILGWDQAPPEGKTNG